MAIYDNNGTTNSEISKVYDNNGTTNSQIGKVYDNNGTTNTLIYEAFATTIVPNATDYPQASYYGSNNYHHNSDCTSSWYANATKVYVYAYGKGEKKNSSGVTTLYVGSRSVWGNFSTGGYKYLTLVVSASTGEHCTAKFWVGQSITSIPSSSSSSITPSGSNITEKFAVNGTSTSQTYTIDVSGWTTCAFGMYAWARDGNSAQVSVTSAYLHN